MLPDAQRATLVARLRAGRTAPPPGIPRRPAGTDPLPLSYGQQQLWFLDQLAPGQSTYNIAGALWLSGRLDVAALRRALTGLVTRHEVLRTRLASDSGNPRQVIDPAGPFPLPVVDLAGLDPRDRDSAVGRHCAEEAEGPFELDRGPLLRASLLRVAVDHHALVLVVHHSVFDGWSFGVLSTELVELYEAELTGRAARLPQLPIQFGDYALWEQERLRGPLLDDLVGYWRETLAGAEDLELPTDRPRPPVQTYAGDVQTIELDAAVLAGLKAIGRREGTTLFVTLMAAFQTLLHRMTGQDDIVVGTVSANRSRAELAPLIGYLVNTLAIRSDLSGDPSFRELLTRVRGRVVDAYAHQDLPFAMLVDQLRVHRDPSRHPVFQVGLNLTEAAEGEPLQATGLTVRPEALGGKAAKFDLLLSAADHGDGLTVTASFATALFDAETIRRLLDHFGVLLHGIVDDEDRPLSRLPLLSAADRRREIVECNDTAAPFPVSCLHQVFERQVATTPDAVAVQLAEADLSYAELNRWANRIARRLHRLGARPGQLVGVCMQRSTDRVAALLAVLKTGAGYVPLDPEYPADRLAFMVEDAELPIVVTDEESASVVPVATAHVVDVDRDRAALATLDDTDPAYPVDPSDVAYVIYTSGSTGRPKGVLVEHRQAVNFAFGEITHWPLGPGDRVLQFASLNFDVSVLDIFGALLSGATLVLGRTETLLSPPRLAELIRSAGITFMCLPPAVLDLLADEQFPDLRVVIAGGEALSSALVHRWVRPGLRFVNGYGPTETTVGATMLECTGTERDPLPIGTPLPNYTAYVLDARLEPVPIGVAGELYLGGAGVARGYLNRPELTAERFVPDPFSTVPGARLYRSGDIVRRLPDKNLQFLGRRDDQVKIRGLRVELGEIEGALAQHPDVVQATVVVRPDRAGQPQLVGYARVDENRPAPDPQQLRSHLATLVPPFMVPTYVMVLAEFPLTANGKVDRKRLPEPATDEQLSAAAPPRTVVEAVLVDMFGSLLNLPSVGVDDSFFDLGGNSLQAMRLVAALRGDLAVDLDLSAIFLAPSAARLAAVLRDKHGLDDAPLSDADPDADPDEPSAVVADPGDVPGTGPLVRLSEGTGTAPLYLLHPISGTVYGYAALARELADDYQVWGVEAAGVREGSRPTRSLEAMIDSYVEAIRGAQPVGPYRLAGWSIGGLIAQRIADRLSATGEHVAFVALLDTPPRIYTDPQAPEALLAALFVADAARAGDAGDRTMPNAETSTAEEQLSWLNDTLANGDPHMRVELDRRFALYKAHVGLVAGLTPTVSDTRTLVVGTAAATDSSAAWSWLLPNVVQSVQVPGDHYSFLQPPCVESVAAALRRAT